MARNPERRRRKAEAEARERGASTEEIKLAEQGRSAQKSLLKTPVSGARLTSGFGMRLHQIGRAHV